jgi:hypothetical protein
MFTVREMVQEKLLELYWVPTWKQYGDAFTKDMQDSLFTPFRKKGTINVTQSPEDMIEETRRAEPRKAQRERRRSAKTMLSAKGAKAG